MPWSFVIAIRKGVHYNLYNDGVKLSNCRLLLIKNISVSTYILITQMQISEEQNLKSTHPS